MIFSSYSSRQGEGLSRPTVQTMSNGSLATVHLAIATRTPRLLAVLSSHNEIFKALLHTIPFSSAASCVFAKMGKRERYVAVSLEGDSHYKVYRTERIVASWLQLEKTSWDILSMACRMCCSTNGLAQRQRSWPE